MSVGKFLHTAGLAALAAAIAVTSVPASAQDRRERMREERDGPREDAGPRARPNNAMEARAQIAQRGERRSEQRAQQVDRRSEQRAQQVDRRSEQRAVRVERQGDRAATQAARQGNWGEARRIDRSSEQAARQIERRGDARAGQVERRGDWRANQVETRGEQRNRTYTDPNRNRTYGSAGNDGDRRWRDNDRRDGNWRDSDRRDNTRWRDNDRRDSSRWGSNDRRDDRRWDRRWRDNDRYDWQRYRSRNRVVFNIGTYYSPYRNYSYRRFGIGGYLNSLFYSQSYWINDPWRYRLPEVYGPYRWVRYYDDVLLVDIYSGEVVDVIYDFFW